MMRESRKGGRLRVAALFACWGLFATTVGLQISCGATTTPTRGTLTLSPGVEFTASSYVYRKLASNTAIDPKSNIWVGNVLAQISEYYGSATVNIDSYSPPIYIAAADAPTVKVLAARSYDPSWSMPALQDLWLNVPLPAGFAPSAGTDEEAIVYQPSTGRYWEFWMMERTGATTLNSAGQTVPQWRAAWGGEIPLLSDNPGYFQTTPQGVKFGTAATGLALLGGLMTIAEQKHGVINHALFIALPETRLGAWEAPAQRTDGQVNDTNAIPQGATFRIPASVNLNAIDMDPYARMLARAAQTYGMVVRDTAGAVAFYAENPVGMSGANPYWGAGGILGCPATGPVPSCYPDSYNRLRGFPWSKLVA